MEEDKFYNFRNWFIWGKVGFQPHTLPGLPNPGQLRAVIIGCIKRSADVGGRIDFIKFL